MSFGVVFLAVVDLIGVDCDNDNGVRSVVAVKSSLLLPLWVLI